MKIGVISDTHILNNTDNLPSEIFNHFKDVDLILHAGDLINISVLDQLRQVTPNVEAVSGNMDSVQTRAMLPEKKIIKANGLNIGLMHGWGAPFGVRKRIWNELRNDNLDVIIYGHTHQPESVYENDVLFLNPGSPTDKRFAKVNSIAVLTINNGKPVAEIIKL